MTKKNSIDERLEEVLLNFRDEEPHTLDESVEALKKAFTEEGYQKTTLNREQVDTVVQEVINQTVKHYVKVGLMSGEHWYSRFEKELESNKQFGDRVNYMWNTETVLETARKASGISDQKDRP